ncbi:MAG TPA: lipopolysaccharide biosynthesis protein [Steroidobacteraceae bacterium]|nr:lipopolysaccharide biosynthesis protein [Steroidobacteraceae bacterium]
MPASRPSLSEILWVGAGQAVTALGTLIGVRVLTQYLSPAGYGVVSLALGMSVLATNLVAAPLSQAAIHYYPRYATDGRLGELWTSLLRCFRTLMPSVGVAALAGGLYYVGWRRGSPLLVAVVMALFAADCWRSANLSLLNAARRQRQVVTWMVSDSWLRPLSATAAVLLVGQYPAAVIAAHATVSATLGLAYSRDVWPLARRRVRADKTLDAGMWAYARPLVPLGVLTWASALGDRYIIGSMLGVADAGLYAAVYGLAYNPFMILNGAAEQALRPIYQSAVSHGDCARAHRILWLWLGTVTGACVLGVLLYTFGYAWLAAHLVGARYRHASVLMPWIALGYGIRCVSYVFERVCYAHGRTWRVLTIQGCSVAATAAVTPLGILNFGLRGAALAVPVCFTVQLLTAFALARRTLREARAATGSTVTQPAHA